MIARWRWAAAFRQWPHRWPHFHSTAAHAVLIGDSGTVLSKGLSTAASIWKAWFTAHEMGVCRCRTISPIQQSEGRLA